MLLFTMIMILLLVITFSLKLCEARDSISMSSNPLIDSGDTLVSAGNIFEFGFFTNDQKSESSYVGIWYYNKFPKTVVWVANRDNPLPLDSCEGAYGLAGDGNLKIWCNNKEFFDITKLGDGESSISNRTLRLLDTGNLKLIEGGGTTIWQSFEYPTDTFLPGMKMSDDIQLVSWTGPNDLSSGNFTFRWDQGAYTIQKRSKLYWRSSAPGPFSPFNELPILVDEMLSNFDRGLDQNSYQLRRSKTSRLDYIYPNYTRTTSYYNNSRILMNYSGEIQYYNYSSSERIWSLLWSAPLDQCSVYKACGKFSICNAENVPVCTCLPGFRSTSFEDGCEREMRICKKKDVFLKLPLMNAESAQVVPFDPAQNDPEKCKQECLDNCDCVAYIYTGVNTTDRTTGHTATMCHIFTDELVNLNEDYKLHRLNLSLRVPFSDTANPSSRICQPCVTNSVPYPLSTGPHCGDPLYYSFHCDNSTGEINFVALNKSYQVVGIYKDRRSFIISVDSEGADACDDRNSLSIRTLKLNQTLPFTVTTWCYNDSTKPETRVGNLVEISWKPAIEPACDSSTDCKDWPNSDCHDKLGNGQKRCYCNKSYQWDDTTANCSAPANANMGREASERAKKKLRVRYAVVFTVLVAGVVLVLCSSYILYWRRRRITRGTGNRGSNEISSVLSSFESRGLVNNSLHENDKSIDVPLYDLNIILSATDNFSDANKLGQGGFGPVYKGTFPGGREIAVKRLSSCSGQGMDEFLNEVILIAKLQHRNLVRLLGYCIKGSEQILLYEYMANRSLDTFVFDQKNCLLLDWKKRFEIILGIARGLLYLHQDSRLRVIHRDLKTSNILLDEEMNPKISDFGLARIVEGKGTESSTNKVVGTYGYMSPEYALEGTFSVKSDVFSFGVVMLEIISGKKNTLFSNQREVLNLLGYAWRLWSENTTLDLIDPTIRGSCNESQAMTCVEIGLLCVQEDPNDRPFMTNVMLMLGNEISSLPNPNQPAFIVRRRLSGTSSSSSSAMPDSMSRNELTISMSQGR
ncbi:hypothetical protein CASFOL_031365 [Castilleja foliolosa]|uniref:non-specific serine/threonine protein kinase n=1 Tax=Castilleja foliolosa TaxID=1961234 RepID=A0ABD3C568_9LAMI